MKVTELIRQRIEKIPTGEPFTTADLLSLGSRAAVDQALLRMERAGQIRRVSRGVYIRPKMNRFVGEVAPEPYQVAKAIAQTTGASLLVHGAEAARQFGLSTQMPTQAVYYTSGPTRHARVGKVEVVLKHTTPRKMALAERPAGAALSALRYLGKGQVTPAVIDTIRKKLGPVEFEALRTATFAMPGWLSDAFHRYRQGTRHA